MDNFTYNYKSTNNQLLSVSDAVNNNAAKKLGDIQPGQSAENYKYDGIGNLIEDKQEEIKNIAWQANGKVKSVTRTPISTKPDLEFKYDAMGQRVAKIVKPKTPNGELLPESEWKYEYYSRDAQGNVMAVYEKKYEKSGANIFDEILSVTEFDIYGSSRIGIVNPKENKLVERRISANTNLQTKKLENITQITKLDYVFNPANISHYRGTKSYELSNHLGNVLATVSDRLIPESTDGLTVSGFKPEIISASDYYPFGMHKPKRTITTDRYRYGFNGMEKDDELKGSGNSYTTHHRLLDVRIARWMSVDPKAGKYPSLSSYSSMGNSPLIITDEGGDTLRVRVNDKQAIADIYSLVPKEHRSRITITNEGIVNINVSVKVEEGTPTGFDGNTSAGVDLLHNLVYSKENYFYGTDNVIRETGMSSKMNLLAPGDNGVHVYSKTKHAPATLSEWNKWKSDFSKAPLNKGKSVIVGDGIKYDGIVFVARDRVFKEGGALKPRSSVVFHELQEVYERSTNGYPYKVPQFDERGYSRGAGIEYLWDDSKRGNSAHYRSEDKENNFHEKSNYPGKVDK